MAWNVLLGTASREVIASADEAPAPRRGIAISSAALWEAERHNSPVFLPETTYTLPKAPRGVVPAGMAMDASPTGVDAAVSYALDQLSHEGLGFLGYPYLAELSQRAEYRKIASIWADHCTRKWIKITGDDEKVKAITAMLDDLNARHIFQEAFEREAFFGRIHIAMDFGDWDKPRELATQLSIHPNKIGPERPLKRLVLLEPMWCWPGQYDAGNPLAPNYYRPSSWYVQGESIHASRLLTMVGHEMPTMLKPFYAFGGVSLTQMCKPYVDNWLRARQSVSDLLNAFSVMVLKTDMDGVLQSGDAEGIAQFFARVDLFNKTRSNRGTFVVDKNAEDFSNVSVPLSGIDKLLAQSQEQMASVSGIPLTILLGITPSGLNASSEGEFRAFYDGVIAYLEKVAGPCVRTLVDVVQLSLFGEIDPEIGFQFVPLWEMSDKDKADIRKSDAEAHGAYIDRGVVDADEVRQCLANDESSLYSGVDLSGPPPEVDEAHVPDEDEAEAA